MSESREGGYHAFFQEGVALMADAMRGPARRVPVYAQMHEFVAEQCGIPRREFFRRPELLISATLEIQAQFGLDVPAITYDVYNIEAEALGQEIRCSEAGMPDIDRDAPLIRDRADLSRIRTPDFYKAYANRHDMPLILGIGAGFLTRARPATIAERVQRHTEVGARGGRFALYLCNLGASTPPANLRAAVAAAHAVSVRELA